MRRGFPALGAPAAEPLYLLVDTAIVGHLGTTELAALALAATLLTSATSVFLFLTYGTTAHVARIAMALGGGGHRAAAGFTSHDDREATMRALRAELREG